MNKSARENRWGSHPANGGYAPERFPAFTIDFVDLRTYEGPGNLSGTDYVLVVSDGDASVEITCADRSETLFEFRGQKYAASVYDGDDGFSYTAFPVAVDAGGSWSEIPEQGTPLPWLPFDLDGVRIDQDTDLPALVARMLGGLKLAGWTRKLWSSLVGTGLEDEVAQAAGACLRSTDPLVRATALEFFTRRVWSSLAGTGLQDEIGRAAGAYLRSTDPLVRASALRFFDSVGQVPGSEVIEEVAAASDVDPLDAVPDPTYASGVTLGKSLRIGLSSRIQSLREAGLDRDRALAIAKRLTRKSRNRRRGEARRRRRAREALNAVLDPTAPSAVPPGRSVPIAPSNRIESLPNAGVDPGRALTIAKNLILQPGRAQGLLTAVSESDWPWFEQHAEEIVKATPAVCGELLLMLPAEHPKDPEWGTLATRLASIPGIDTEELWMWAESSLSGDALASVRAALDARGRSQ